MVHDEWVGCVEGWTASRPCARTTVYLSVENMVVGIHPLRAFFRAHARTLGRVRPSVRPPFGVPLFPMVRPAYPPAHSVGV